MKNFTLRGLEGKAKCHIKSFKIKSTSFARNKNKKLFPGKNTTTSHE